MIEVDQLKSTVNQYSHNVIIQSCECVIPPSESYFGLLPKEVAKNMAAVVI